MTTAFPTDKTQPFVAENGVTYVWDADRWRVKTYKKEDDSRLPYRLGTDKAARSGEAAVELVDAQDNYSNVKFFGVNGIECESTISGIKIDGHQLMGSGDIDLSSYATIEYSDAEDSKLQLQIDELGVTKGKVARYTTENTSGTPVSRPGQLAVNTSYPPNTTIVSFGIEDADGVLTKPMADGDIIEFVDAVSSKVSRYKIIDASGAPTAISVEYISGDNDFAVGEEEQVYIYPQNSAGVSKDYVDDALKTKINETGDTMSGALVIDNGSQYNDALEIKAYDDTQPGKRRSTFKIGADGKITAGGLIKTTRNTGYAWQIKPDDGDANTWFHTNGTFNLGGSGSIDGDLDISTASHGVRILGSFKVKAGGGTISGSNNFEAFGDYAAYNGLITADNHLVNKKYVDDHAGGGVEIYNGPNPPSGKARGTLLLTTNNALYIYTGS